ncbi:MAG: hypothetical protein QOK28_3554 [Actinomycetota bacterium]
MVGHVHSKDRRTTRRIRGCLAFPRDGPRDCDSRSACACASLGPDWTRWRLVRARERTLVEHPAQGGRWTCRSRRATDCRRSSAHPQPRSAMRVVRRAVPVRDRTPPPKHGLPSRSILRRSRSLFRDPLTLSLAKGHQGESSHFLASVAELLGAQRPFRDCRAELRARGRRAGRGVGALRRLGGYQVSEAETGESAEDRSTSV